MQNTHSNWGIVKDYDTGEAIRPATVEEWGKTASKSISKDSDNYTGAWIDSDGRIVYVTGGPDLLDVV